MYKPTKCIKRPVYLLSHRRGLWNCWRVGKLTENKRQEIFQWRLISRVIFINKYNVRAGRNREDYSSNVVLAPSPTPPDEETAATGGKVVHSFIYSLRYLLRTYYMPSPVLRAGSRWKVADSGPQLGLNGRFYTCCLSHLMRRIGIKEY